MDDSQLLAAIDSNTRFLRAVGRASPGAHLIERPGVLATLVPAAPQRSVVNCVVYDDPDALIAAYDELAAAFEAVGVRAWTVWAPPNVVRVTSFLAANGHVFDAAPEMMGMGLDELTGERPDGPEDWARAIEPALLGRINDEAYGFGSSFEAAFADFPLEQAHWYVARLDGEPVVCLMVLDEGSDVDVNMVAALPRARGRGLVGRLMTHALIDARERGRLSATLIATMLGRPVYERIGFRPLGQIEMWERRA